MIFDVQVRTAQEPAPEFVHYRGLCLREMFFFLVQKEVLYSRLPCSGFLMLHNVCYFDLFLWVSAKCVLPGSGHGAVWVWWVLQGSTPIWSALLNILHWEWSYILEGTFACACCLLSCLPSCLILSPLVLDGAFAFLSPSLSPAGKLISASRCNRQWRIKISAYLGQCFLI